MSSFNSVERVRYHQDKEEIVSLEEYIIFTDERNKLKYLLFKFSNNINKVLNDIKFEVHEFDENSNLIEKVIFTYNDFKANENEQFVPNAKIRVSYDCKKIKVILLYARFDFIKWEAGEFSRIPYSYDEYKSTYRNTNRPDDIELVEEKKARIEKERFQNKKHRKSSYKMLDVSKKNKVRYPKILTSFFSSLLLVGIIVSVIFFVRTNDEFSDDSFLYKIKENETVEVIECYDEDGDIFVPSIVEEMRVVKLADGLFKENKQLTKVKLESERIEIGSEVFKDCVNLRKIEASGATKIGKEAFMGCKNLEEIHLDNAREIEKGAFNDCGKLKIFDAPNATLNSEIFLNASSLESLTYGEFTGYQLGLLFGDDGNIDIPLSLTTINTNTASITRAFLLGSKNLKRIIIRNKDAILYSDIESDFYVTYKY